MFSSAGLHRERPCTVAGLAQPLMGKRAAGDKGELLFAKGFQAAWNDWMRRQPGKISLAPGEGGPG